MEKRIASKVQNMILMNLNKLNVAVVHFRPTVHRVKCSGDWKKQVWVENID